jgi:AcrR family transcriptional regulator
MRSWIPVPGTTSGRLVVAALQLFGAHGFAPVPVSSIAEHAGVTTGSLYHHFGSKAGLYQLVRADVEQRVLDRMEGAAAGRTVRSVADLAPVLLVGFDYLVGSGFTRLLGEPAPEPAAESHQPDQIERLLGRMLVSDGPVETLIAAAWRSALWHASDGPDSARDARAALARLLTGG